MLIKAISLDSLGNRMPFIEIDYGQVRQLMERERIDSPFMMLSRTVVRRNLEALRTALPGVKIQYAIKSNSQPAILAEVAAAGHSFDIASYDELKLAVAAGGKVSEFVHSHPIKSAYEMDRALEAGVDLFIADNPDEIEKFRRIEKKVRIMLRLKIEDSSALVNLSYKFGCMPHDVLPLVRKIKEVGHEFGGLAFHVGSQCLDNGIYIYAVEVVGKLIEQLKEAGYDTPLVDIGGGFPAPYTPDVPAIENFCGPIAEALKKNIPSDVTIMCEPGRYVSASAVTLVTTVIGKSKRAGKLWYYLDDGMYGSFSGRMYDHARPLPITGRNGGFKRSVLAGPTCDSIDVIYKEISLPSLEIGDLLMFPAMGAYSSVSASTFNSLRKAEYFVID